MARTVQRTQLIRKTEDERDLGITIECVNCRAYRTFKVTAQLEAVVDEELKSLGIVVECEECGRLIDVAIGWYMNDGPGQPTNPRKMVGRGPGFQQVQDPIGLRKYE